MHKKSGDVILILAITLLFNDLNLVIFFQIKSVQFLERLKNKNNEIFILLLLLTSL